MVPETRSERATRRPYIALLGCLILFAALMLAQPASARVPADIQGSPEQAGSAAGVQAPSRAPAYPSVHQGQPAPLRGMATTSLSIIRVTRRSAPPA
jgi:hypothetical protein